MMPSQTEDIFNEGASTSKGGILKKPQEKKKNVPWIEKFRPTKFEEIMGKKNYCTFSNNALKTMIILY